jgi:hypothetical protein
VDNGLDGSVMIMVAECPLVMEDDARDDLVCTGLSSIVISVEFE